MGDIQMRLFIKSCHICGRKIQLNILAPNRYQLSLKIGHRFNVNCSHCKNTSSYHVNDVFAERGIAAAPAGVILGGLIGLIGGPLGVIVGGGIGGLMGKSSDNQDEVSTKNFNRSRC